MLEDVELRETRSEIEELVLRLIESGNIKNIRIEKGIYKTHLNFFYDIKTPVKQFWIEDIKEAREYGDEYGVCDSIEQFKRTKLYEKIVNDKRKFCISFTEIKKSEQSRKDGWRWEKWGEYIGEKESKAEYLYDEPKIVSVFVFNIFLIMSQEEKENEKQ